MPSWVMELLLAGGGLAAVFGAIATLFKTWREERKLEIERRAALVKNLEERIERLQTKVESLLMDAIAREKEAVKQAYERLEMDAKQADVLSAATVALKDATMIMGKKHEPIP